MENWMGQDITPGDFVYRGAREGNGSSFKVGQVLYLREEKRSARVTWLFTQTYYHHKLDPNRFEFETFYNLVGRIGESYGSCTIDSLVLLDPDVMTELYRRSDILEAVRGGDLSLLPTLAEWSGKTFPNIR